MAVSLAFSSRPREPFGFGRALYQSGGCLLTPVVLVGSVAAICGDAAEDDFLACFGPLPLRSSCSADSAGRFFLSGRDSLALLALERRLLGGGSSALENPPLFSGMTPNVTRLGEGPELAALLAGRSVAADSEGFLLGNVDSPLFCASFPEWSRRCWRGFHASMGSSSSD